MEKKFTIPPAAAIYWSIAVVLVAFAYFNLIPIALFQKMKTKGVLDAQNQIGLIENLDSEKFKEGGINFVEIAREKSEPFGGLPSRVQRNSVHCTLRSAPFMRALFLSPTSRCGRP